MKKKIKLNRPLKILLITNSLVYMASAMLGPIYALFVEKIGGNLLDASFAVAIYALAAGITTLISGNLTDKVKENELIIVLGYTIIGIGFMLYLFVNSIYSLLLIQILIGLGEAIYYPAFFTVYSQHLDGYKFGRQWGAWGGITYITWAIGAAIGGVIVTYAGFNTIFLIMSLMTLASALYIYLLPRKVL